VLRTPRPRSAAAHWGILLLIAGLVVVVDQVSKAIVRGSLARGEEDEVLGLRLHHLRNDGLLGGHLSGVAIPVGILTLVVVVLGLRAYARRRDASFAMRLFAGLLLGGALGNMLDRLRLGYVTDWIARGERNAFNLADLAIYVGLGGLALLLLLDGRRRPEDSESDPGDGEAALVEEPPPLQDAPDAGPSVAEEPAAGAEARAE
jgi:signal peptidase II